MGLFNRSPYARLSGHEIASRINDCLRRRDFETGAALAEELIRRDPQSGDGYYYKALALNQPATAGAAISPMERAMSLLRASSPGDRDTMWMYKQDLLSIYVNAKEIDAALDLFDGMFDEAAQLSFCMLSDFDFFLYEMAMHSKMSRMQNTPQWTDLFATLTQRWVRYSGEKPDALVDPAERQNLEDLYFEIMHRTPSGDSKFALIRRGEY